MTEYRRRSAAPDVLSALREQHEPSVPERTEALKHLLGAAATTFTLSGFKAERVQPEKLHVELPGGHGGKMVLVIQNGELWIQRRGASNVAKQAPVPLVFRRHVLLPDAKLTGDEQIETYERHLVWEPAIDVLARVFVEVARE